MYTVAIEPVLSAETSQNQLLAFSGSARIHRDKRVRGRFSCGPAELVGRFSVDDAHVHSRSI